MRVDEGMFGDVKGLKNELNMLGNDLVIWIEGKGVDVIKWRINGLKEGGRRGIMVKFKVKDEL
uniref:hypothetical protein n=1 Tax=Bacillus pumilus TaxID=1408 RepID=UPI001C92CEB7